MSLVEMLTPLTLDEQTRLTGREGVGEESLLDRIGLSMVKFMSYVNSVVTAIIVGARFEGFKPRSVKLSFSDDGVPVARALVELDGVVFVVYARPYVDVEDVDAVADEAADVAESYEGVEVIPVLAAFQYSYYAERYAKSLGIELVRLEP